MRNAVTRPWLVLLLALAVPVPAVDVLMQHNDVNRTGATITETILTRSNVNQTQFGRVFKMQVDGQVFAQPLYVSNLDLGVLGTHNVVIIATENNAVYCFDAVDPGSGGTGKTYWSINLGIGADNGNGGCGDLSPRVGITGTPVIDKAAGTIYLISKTNTGGTYANKLHALNLVDGSNRAGSPVTVAGTFPKVGGGTTTFGAQYQFNRPGLLLANGRVYAGFGSHCDQGTYQGWVFGWDTANLATAPVVYCTSPNGNQGAVWQSGRGLVADGSGNIYCATGNGAFDGNNPGDKGMALLKLSPTLALQSFFINGNAVAENGGDDDFGSGGPLLVPGTNRLVMAGKPGNIFVCDTASLGGYTNGANNCIQAITGGNGLNAGSDGNAQAPVYWNSPSGPNVYYWAGRNGNNFPRCYRYNTGTSQLNVPAISTGTVTQGGRAGGISLSANGSTAGTGILWSIKSDAGGNAVPGPGRLIALNAEDLTVTLYDSQQNAARDSLGNYTKLSYPTIAEGHVYVPTLNASDTTNYVAVYGLLGGNPPVKLKFVGQPASALTGASLGTVTVAVVDVADNPVTSATTDVHLDFGANPGGATLAGTTTVTTVNGVATFSNLSVNNAGTNYTLVATSTIGTVTSIDIGGPGLAGAHAAQPSGYDVTGGGDDITGTADKFRYSYLSISGDFDLRTRVNAVVDTPPGGADYTKSGLMAREGIAANSRNVMALVFPSNTPTHNANTGGYEYQFRSTDGGGTTPIHPGETNWSGGAINVSYPNGWLRLEKIGGNINAYASTDGVTWTQYITSNASPLADPFLVGFAECAHDNTKTALAQFRQVSLKIGAGNRILQLDPATSTTFTITNAALTQPPVFTPGTGTFSGPVTVTMTSATGGAAIYYTTNGTTPTTASTLYSAGSPPLLSATTTLKAIATHAGMSNSTVTTAVYTISGSTPYGLPTRGTLPTLTIPAAGATTGTLSGTGLFANTAAQTPSAGVVPYTVNAQLWSDGAAKLRWVAIPNGAQIVFQGTGEFAYPNGTVFVKHFELGTDDTNASVRKRLETRVLVINATAPNYGYGLTYKWRADNSDADLIATAGVDEVETITTASGTRTETWHYPSRSECLTCHLSNASFVLGAKAAQLNGTFAYPSSGVSDNQLRTWNYLRLFTTDIGESSIPALAHTVAIGDTTATLDARVKSYLEANCAFCHRPGGVSNAFTDGRFATDLTSMGLINVAPNKGNFGITGAMIVLPFDVSKSILSYRVHSTSATLNEKMPPLARNLVDTQAVAVIDQWIGSGATGQPATPAADDNKKSCGLGSLASLILIALGALVSRLWLIPRNRSNLQ